MKITPEENELLLALAAEFNHAEYDPERHVLVKDAASLWGISGRAATTRLEKLVEKGHWGKETVMHRGRPKSGYYKRGGCSQ